MSDKLRANATRPRYQRKLRNYLVDARLQLRYVAFVTLLSALISGSLGYLIWKQEDDASETIIATFESSELGEDESLKEDIVERLTTYDNNLVLTMVAAGIGLVVVLSLYMIVMTHKVAGPLHKVSEYFDQMAQGRLGDVHSLRKGDLLVRFYQKFRDAHQAVRKRHREENAVVGKFLEACEQAEVGRDGTLENELRRFEAYYERREASLS